MAKEYRKKSEFELEVFEVIPAQDEKEEVLETATLALLKNKISLIDQEIVAYQARVDAYQAAKAEAEDALQQAIALGVKEEVGADPIDVIDVPVVP